MSHLNEAEKAKLGKKTFQEYGAEARRLQPQQGLHLIESERAALETAHAKVLQRRFAPLGLELVGFDEEGEPIIIDHGPEKGLCLHGESKDGDIVMTDTPDLAGQFTITEKLLDRTYGRARQTTTLEGNPNKPIRVQPVRTVERAQALGELLSHVHALASKDPHGDPEATVVEPKNPRKLIPFKGGNNSVDTERTPASTD